MARFKVDKLEMDRFQRFVIEETNRIIVRAIDNMDAALFAQAGILADEIKNSQEFQAIKTPVLIGKFGFTPQEVANLDNLFPIIGPKADNEVTNISKVTAGKSLSAVLQWVDFERLKFHQVADHPLTKLNPQSKQFEVTGVVSWIEWWEHGMTVRGHIFIRGNVRSLPSSRSHEGLMQTRSGSMFQLHPTRIFERTGEQAGRGVADRIATAFKKVIGEVA